LTLPRADVTSTVETQGELTIGETGVDWKDHAMAT
jgi:hypothetical protein